MFFWRNNFETINLLQRTDLNKKDWWLENFLKVYIKSYKRSYKFTLKTKRMENYKFLKN